MWIFTSHGMVSAVAHRDKPGMLMIRARKRQHLEALFPGSPIVETIHADYKYRVLATKAGMQAIMAEQIANIEYDNFKNSIPDHQYHDACSRVWGVMHSIQPGSYYGRDYGAKEFDTYMDDYDAELPWEDEDDPQTPLPLKHYLGAAIHRIEDSRTYHCETCAVELPVDELCPDCTQGWDNEQTA